MARPVPADLEDALAASPAARDRFWALPPERLDEWVGWIEAPRLPRTRRRRIAETVRRLGAAPRPAAAATAVETNGAAPLEAPARDAALGLWLLALAALLAIAALVLWLTVFRHHHSGSTTPAAAATTVPSVVGLREQAARAQLRQAKLVALVLPHQSAKPRGVVLGQRPRGGVSVAQGSRVTLETSAGPAAVAVPRVVGLKAGDAAKPLQSLKLVVVTKRVPSKQPANTVLGQKPAAGKRVPPGSKVLLVVAAQKPTAAVPGLLGQTQQAAVATLTKDGLRATVVQVPSTQPSGTVVAQNPPAGKIRPRSSAVRLNVSRGAATQTTATGATTTQASAPPPPPAQGAGHDYRGMQLANAVQKIVQGRQQVLVVWIASSRPQGVVVANSTAGSRVRLQVSAGAKPAQPTSVPDVTGESQAQATSDLQAAGFTVITAQWPVSDSSADGMVVAETPAGGGNAPQGAAIVLYIGTASGG